MKIPLPIQPNLKKTIIQQYITFYYKWQTSTLTALFKYVKTKNKI